MSLIIQLLIFSVSTFLLAKSGQIVVKSSVDIAKLTKLGELAIGFILISAANALPELVVSINAILSGNTDVAVGNILGSNIANICLVIGSATLFKTIEVTEKTLKKLSIMLFLLSFVLVGLLLLRNASRFVGIVLLVLFGMFYLYFVKKKIILDKIRLKEPKEFFKILAGFFKLYKTLFVLCIGALGIFVASIFVINSTSKMASILGITGSVIGATIIAIGTALPDLTTIITALKEGHPKLGLGTTIGSCITNITLILGFVLMLSNFTINMTIFSTMLIFLLVSSLLLWLFLSKFSRKRLDKFEAVVLLLVYVIFLLTMFGIQLSIMNIFRVLVEW